MRTLNYLIFFPSLTFSVIAAEIFPWALLWSFTKKIKFSLILALLMTLLVGALASSMVLNGFQNALKDGLSVINPALAFIVMLSLSERSISKYQNIAKNIFWFLIVLGILQLSGILTPFTNIFEFIIPRGSAEVLGAGRGVSLLSSEPSRAGVEICFLYTVVRFKIDRQKKWLLDLIFFVFIVFVIKSAVALVFCVILFTIMRPYISFLGILLILNLLLIYSDNGIRSLILISQLLSSVNLMDLAHLIINQSGFRIISVFSSYYYGIFHLFPSGFGSWPYLILEAFHLAGFQASEISFFRIHGDGNFFSVKPTSFAAAFTLQQGLLIASMFFIFFYVGLRSKIQLNSIEGIACLVIFLFYVFVVGAVGNPVPWICTALLISKKIQKSHA